MLGNFLHNFEIDKKGSDGIYPSLFEVSGAFVFSVNDREKSIRQLWELVTEVPGI